MKIRTVKPELYRHKGLFELERDTRLPIRIAWAGLFGACDREGRFKWDPENLKLDILPFDPVDFSLVLDVLAAHGYILKYRKKPEGNPSTATHVRARAEKCFGLIPTFLDHQRPNQREAKSVIPAFDNTCEQIPVAIPTFPVLLETHVHARGEGKGSGREVEGKGNGSGRESIERTRKKKSVNASEVIATYCRTWKERYGIRPEVLPKDLGIAKRLAEGLGTDRASHLVESYLRMNTAWFITKRHDLATLEQNVNAVVQFHETGVQVSQAEAKHADSLSFHENQLRRIAEGTL